MLHFLKIQSLIAKISYMFVYINYSYTLETINFKILVKNVSGAQSVFLC